MEITEKAPITFTDSARKEIHRLWANKDKNDHSHLRIGVKGGGCSGLSYLLGFEEKEEKDTLYLVGEVPVIINPAHLIYLADMEIDWQGGLNARGFTFSNPNASTSCGCGTSFAV